ncbi:MAG: hypothetical protein JXB88_06625 [Spirochaetales bacterium]|nr:hypothetical protein [Spirochaetales bacterium]
MKNEIKETFDSIAITYDSQRRKIIPCFDDFYKIITNLTDSNINNPEILDIGAGTGLLTKFVTTQLV